MAAGKVLSVLLIVQGIVAREHFTDFQGEAYYWRAFDGNFPSQALSAGKSTNGANIYVGQVSPTYFQSIPAHVSDVDKNAEFVYETSVHKTSSNFLILCSETKAKFEWAPTDSKNLIKLLQERQFVRGGVENGRLLLIGRTKSGGRVGKITLFDNYSTFAYASDNKILTATNFEVLSYKK